MVVENLDSKRFVYIRIDSYGTNEAKDKETNPILCEGKFPYFPRVCVYTILLLRIRHQLHDLVCGLFLFSLHCVIYIWIDSCRFV